MPRRPTAAAVAADNDPVLHGNQQQDVDSQQGTTECRKDVVTMLQSASGGGQQDQEQ
ncbi:hypothetical protein HaLaN_22601, partial [Haematococcus lacustris]